MPRAEHLTYLRAMLDVGHRARLGLAALALMQLLATAALAQDPEPAATVPPTPTEEPSAPAEPATGAEVASTRKDTALANALDRDDRMLLDWTAGLLWDHGYGAAGLLRDTGQTFNPTYSWDLIASVGYNFNRDTTLSLIQPMTFELTDSDTTNSRQQFLLDDTGIDLAHTFLRLTPHEGQDLKVSLSGRLLLPTSLASRAATMMLGTRARIQAKYIFEHVLHGLLAYGGARYTRRWNRSDTLETEAPYACTTLSSDASRNCAHLGGSTTRDLVLLEVGAELAFAKQWTVGASLSFGWALARSLDDADLPIASGSVIHVADSSGTHWRNSRLIELTVGYDFTTWFRLSALMSNRFDELGPDGKYRAPFVPYDTAVGARLEFSFDQLYLSTRAHAGG